MHDSGQIVVCPRLEGPAAHGLQRPRVKANDQPVVRAVPTQLCLQRVDRRRLCTEIDRWIDRVSEARVRVCTCTYASRVSATASLLLSL
jgi:hypothetical protein